MKKKVLAGILAATMAFSMAACGSTGSSSDSGSSAASGSTAKTEEKGEPYTVTMVLQGSQQPDEERIEEKINEILEPELNAKLDIVVLPWASASQQLQLMLSGDEKIDLLYTSATTAVQYMHSGQIMDMSELIDKYGTNLKDIYGEDIAKTNQIDGFVYGVPNQIERGSIPAIFMRKDLVEKYHGVTAEGLVESALDKVKLIEDMGYDNLVISIKSSDVMMCVKAHELISDKTNHPLHVGITEAGTIISGNIKSAIGLGLILSQGIGDTIRVSLTGSPLEEIKSAKLILRTLGLRKGGIEVVSCPTCGRTQIDLIGLANQVETMVSGYDLDIKVAVMGCVVNGPGEAKEADLGVAGGIGEGLIIKHGEVFKKVPESELLGALKYELDHWGE